MSSPVEIRRGSDGSIDEVVATAANFHIEQMSDKTFWFCLTIGGHEWHFALASKAAITLICVPDGGNH